jgi:hypothetical protein
MPSGNASPAASTASSSPTTSAAAAKTLEERSPAGTHRVATDRRAPGDIAADIVTLTGWAQSPRQDGQQPRTPQ